MPKEGNIAAPVLASVAEHSLGETSDGRWTMKFDRESFLGSDGIDVIGAIAKIRDPLLLIRAEHSRIMTVEGVAQALAVNPRTKVATVARAHHHVILERPAEVARAVEEFFAGM